METIVKVEELKSVIKKNRDEHRAVFEKAIEGYREQVIDVLDKRIDQLKKNKLPNLYVNIPQPEDHTDDYDRILKMLELHSEDTIELGEQEVSQYVLDNWMWKAAFENATMSNINYVQSKARRKKK